MAGTSVKPCMVPVARKISHSPPPMLSHGRVSLPALEGWKQASGKSDSRSMPSVEHECSTCHKKRATAAKCAQEAERKREKERPTQGT